MIRVDWSALGTGIGVVAFGLVLLLQADGSINLESGWLLAVLTACTGAALIASGLGARQR